MNEENNTSDTNNFENNTNNTNNENNVNSTNTIENKESTQKVLKVRGIAKEFHGNLILKNINFELEKGIFCALLGENGVGKSTLLNILMGQESFEIGEGEILGKNIKDDLGKLKNQIGLVTEKINYDIPITIGNFFKRYADFFTNWDEDFFLKTMKERGLSLDNAFSQYSRGQKMQTALIAALAIKPKILLIDEITAVLDIYARNFFMEMLKKFTSNGGTVLITTNIISEIQFVVDKIIILNNGEIQLNERVKEIPYKFVKLRTKEPNLHYIFTHPSCFWSKQNSDGSSSFILPSSVARQFDIPHEFLDRRSVTLDEIFIYFIKTGDKNFA
ncbi:MAG: ATP-binding cassette domain-containing protein [Oligoflexia bacterium]|nr:ATP-binding cassette domain-containing protein [Oligoflexia bacterium]